MKFWVLKENLKSLNNFETLKYFDPSIEVKVLETSNLDEVNPEEENFFVAQYSAYFHFEQDGSIVIPNSRPYDWPSNYQWSTSYLQLIREANRKGMYILLDYFWEAETTIHTCTLFFLQRCSEFFLDTSNLILCTNNGLYMGVRDTYIKNYPIKKLNFPWWLLRSHQELCTQPFELDNIDKTKSILCKNRTLRINKLEALGELHDRGLLTDSSFTIGIVHPNIRFRKHHNSLTYKVLDFLETYNIDLDNFESIQLENDAVYGPEIKNDRYLFFTQKNWYEKTKISVVNETFYYDYDPLFLFNEYHDKKVHLTEKTWKAIVFGHPFIMVGEERSLQVIQELGFKTFDTVIDESYDLEPDSTRMNSAIDQVSRLVSLYHSNEVQEIVKFNRDRIFDKEVMDSIFIKYFIDPLKSLQKLPVK